MKKNANLILSSFLLILIITNSCETKEEVQPGPDPISFIDSRDGNTYKAVQLGDQVWMAENLNFDAGADSWVYDNNPLNAAIYGRLYQWVKACEVCPEGWHLPSDEEWKTMEMYLGMSQSEADKTFQRGTDEGGKMKEAGFEHWASPNTGATNSSGLKVLPAGRYNYATGYYALLSGAGTFWTSSEYNCYHSWTRELRRTNSQVNREYLVKTISYSVRCVKD